MIKFFFKKIFILIVSLYSNYAIGQNIMSNHMVGEALPNLSFKTMTGDSIRLNDLKGKIVVLNLFFRQCPHCIIETPFLNSLTEKYADTSKIIFLAISSRDDSAQLAKHFIKKPFKYKVSPSPQAAKGKDWVSKTHHGLLEKHFKTSTYPTNIIADENGKIILYLQGFTKGKTDFELTKAIDDLLKTYH